MTCPHAQKVEHMRSCRKCKLDGLVCSSFDVDALVAICPTRAKFEFEKKVKQ